MYLNDSVEAAKMVINEPMNTSGEIGTMTGIIGLGIGIGAVLCCIVIIIRNLIKIKCKF